MADKPDGVPSPIANESPADRFAQHLKERAADEASQMESPIVNVNIVDISIPFGSMVGLLLNVALAAIPAVIVLVVLGFMFVAIVGGLGMATLGR